ncbi:MAG TPA: hypothetical protein DCQ06_07895 [Myxococcales bacterium]|nr:hypothetical protein [Myxococcales bacterium]HAN31505.1 hypothetical protein [Myxococcales bacterium]
MIDRFATVVVVASMLFSSGCASKAAPLSTAGWDVSPWLNADTAGGSDSGTSACIANQRRCAAEGTPEVCLNGVWIALAACVDGYTCSSGQCLCAKQCSAIGQVDCVEEIEAVRTCELVDGCLKWSVPTACQPGFQCIEGQCKTQCSPQCPQGQVCQDKICVPQKVGTLSCGQIVACVNQFAAAANDKVNIDACIAKGTIEAQQLYAARKSCIALSCQKLIDAGAVNEALLCVYSNCGVDQSTCLGAGQQSCEELGSCLSGCGTSATCSSGCHTSAAVQAVKSWYTLAVCGEQYCPGRSGQAYANCVTQSCIGPYQGCFGASAGGGGGAALSCAQVLQCAGQCTDKTCAQACKNKASAQALAALDALLLCNSSYCATACGTGTQQQCDACLAANCSQELQGCS